MATYKGEKVGKGSEQKKEREGTSCNNSSTEEENDQEDIKRRAKVECFETFFLVQGRYFLLLFLIVLHRVPY